MSALVSAYMDLYYAFSTLLKLVNDLQTENNELYNTNVRLDKMLKSLEDDKVKTYRAVESFLDYVFVL